jgi:hypothetical protein
MIARVFTVLKSTRHESFLPVSEGCLMDWKEIAVVAAVLTVALCGPWLVF